MKPGSDPIKKSDSDPVTEPGGDKQGIDFLKVLQIGCGIIAACALLWIILRNVLHII